MQLKPIYCTACWPHKEPHFIVFEKSRSFKILGCPESEILTDFWKNAQNCCSNATVISTEMKLILKILPLWCKPQLFGCLLLIRYLFKFNFSKLAQLTILQAGFEKNSILYINPDFWVPLRNFFLNLGALSIKHARGFKVSTLIFLKILPLFDQKIAKYGLKNAFWSWKQQLWTVDFNITKIHGVSPLHLYSNVYIGFFLLLNIYEGVRVLHVCVRLAYFWKVCEARFSTFFQKFLGL